MVPWSVCQWRAVGGLMELSGAWAGWHADWGHNKAASDMGQYVLQKIIPIHLDAVGNAVP